MNEVSNHYALIRALPLAALLLLDEGQVAYATQLYSIAKRYPYVANSRWYADVVGKHIDAAVSSSSGNSINPIDPIEFGENQELCQIVPWIFDVLSLHQHALAS